MVYKLSFNAPRVVQRGLTEELIFVLFKKRCIAVKKKLNGVSLAPHAKPLV